MTGVVSAVIMTYIIDTAAVTVRLGRYCVLEVSK